MLQKTRIAQIAILHHYHISSTEPTHNIILSSIITGLHSKDSLSLICQSRQPCTRNYEKKSHIPLVIYPRVEGWKLNKKNEMCMDVSVKLVCIFGIPLMLRAHAVFGSVPFSTSPAFPFKSPALPALASDLDTPETPLSPSWDSRSKMMP